MGQLAAKIRAKYPGSYDDMDDETLERTVLEKHPEYKDLVKDRPLYSDKEVDPNLIKNRDYYREIESAGGDTKINSPAAKSFQKPQPKKLEKVNPPNVETPEEPGILSKIYHAVSDPLTTAPSRFAKSVADYIDNPQGEGGYWHGLAAGSIQGAGDVLSSLTSPLNLATIATGTGSAIAAKRALPELATALNYGTKALSAPVAAHGAFNLVNPDSSMSERLMAIPEIAGGLAGMKSRIPEMVRPLESGDWATRELQALESGKYNPELDNIIRNSPYGEGSIMPSSTLPTELRTEGVGDIQSGPVLRVRDDILSPLHDDPSLVAVGEEKGFNSSFDMPVRKTADELSYELAREKFNMGKDLPESVEEPKLEFNPEEVNVEQALKESLADRLSKLGADETGAVGDLGDSVETPNPRQAAEFGDAATSEETGIKKDINKGKVIFNPEELDPSLPVVKRAKPAAYKASTAEELYNAPRGLMSVDLPFMTSAAFRQASPLAWTKNWFNAWNKAAKAFGSEGAYKEMQNNIANSQYVKPRYRAVTDRNGNITSYRELPSVAEDAGLKLTDLNNLTSREEAIAGSLAEKIPGYGRYVRASNRAYTAFLNDLRNNTFSKLMNERNSSSAAVTPSEIANFVNHATGRGKLEVGVGNKNINLEQHVKLLSNTLFSPRLIASRVKFLNPSTYVQASPMVRAEYLKGLARSIGTWWAIAGLAEIAGATVSKDPNSADFGKIKIGNTRIDPGAGFQQYLVLGSRLGSGKFTSSGTGKTSVMGQGFKPRTRLSTAEEFAANKLHPVARFAWDLMNSSASKPFKLMDEVVQRVLPMMVGDIVQAAKTDPELAALVGLGSSVGMGTQTYEPGSFNKSVFINPKSDFTFTGGRLGGMR